MLSEEDYGAYKRYKRFEEQWVIVSQINKELKFHGVQLNKDQEDQLVAAMFDDRQEMMAKQMRETQQGGVPPARSQEDMMKKVLEYQKAISEMYVESAKNILSEPQLKQLKRYFDNQIYSYEKMLINRRK